MLACAPKVLKWEAGLDALGHARCRPRIATPVIVRAVVVMFLGRPGSLNALRAYPWAFDVVAGDVLCTNTEWLSVGRRVVKIDIRVRPARSCRDSARSCPPRSSRLEVKCQHPGVRGHARDEDKTGCCVALPFW